MKRIITLLCVFILCTALLPAAVNAEDTCDLVRADEYLTLYETIGSTDGYPYYVDQGDYLYYLGGKVFYRDHYWYSVLYCGTCVYICDRYSTLFENVSRVKTTASLALRTGAGTENRLIRNIPSGTVISILGVDWDLQGGLWYLVSYGRNEGYVSSFYTAPVEDDPHRDDQYGAQVLATLTERSMATRSGPSTKYYETGSFYTRGTSVKLYSRIYDSVNEIWWVQADAYDSGRWCRVYTGSWRFSGLNIYDLPEEHLHGYATLRNDCRLRCGPGSSYGYYDARVYSGRQVQVWAYENGWAQIEVTVGGVPYRGWVETGSLW
ncbi:MAG: hypothetical protein CW338_04620 [Clostridiales bacterium]|nr:hypothetical protein [Clostridiales bacterium]